MSARYCLRATVAIAAITVVLLAVTGPPSETALLREWGSLLPPWMAYRAVMMLTTVLDRARDAILPPQLRMVEHSMAFSRTQVVHVLAALRIPDLLADGPKSAEELAPLAGVVSADALWRVLRLAKAQGALAAATDRSGVMRFRNNALSSTLRADHPTTVRDFVIMQGQEIVSAWSGLLPALLHGKVPWEEAHQSQGAAGRDFWGYLKANPATEELFSRSMANADAIGVNAMLADYHWRRFTRFIDVGGAHGSFLAALLARHPNASGVLFDLPQVVERAKEAWQQQRPALMPRTAFQRGSFFDAGTLPAAKGSKDVYIMRVILHDWSDDKAVAILRNVRTAIGDSKATLALLEIAPRDGLQETYEGIVYMDVQMLVVCDGRERSPWTALFAASGFRLEGIHPTRGTLKVVEAAPI